MTGPEHYREAERVIDHAEEHAEAESEQWYANAMANAQVHADLAKAAATAFASAGLPQDGDAAAEWRRAISRPRAAIVNIPPSPSSPEEYECCASGSCEVCRA